MIELKYTRRHIPTFLCGSDATTLGKEWQNVASEDAYNKTVCRQGAVFECVHF